MILGRDFIKSPVYRKRENIMRRFIYPWGVILLIVMPVFTGCGTTSNNIAPAGVRIIRQYTWFNSGVKYPESHVFYTQDEATNFYHTKIKEGAAIPYVATPTISENEMCVVLFAGELDAFAFTVQLIEEPDRIIFKFDVPEYQRGAPYSENDKLVEIEKQTPFGYFVIPKTSKKIQLEHGGFVLFK